MPTYDYEEEDNATLKSEETIGRNGIKLRRTWVNRKKRRKIFITKFC